MRRATSLPIRIAVVVALVLGCVSPAGSREPEGSAPPQLVAQIRNMGVIRAVATSSDGRVALAASVNRSGTRAVLWDPRTGLALRSFVFDRGSGEALALSADGRFLLVSGASGPAPGGPVDGFVVVDIASGKELGPYAGVRAKVTAVAWSADADELYVGTDEGSVFGYRRTAPDKPRWKVAAHAGRVTALVGCSENRCVFSGGKDGKLVRTRLGGKSTTVVHASDAEVTSLALGPHDLVSADAAGVIHLHERRRPTKSRVLWRTKTGRVTDLLIDPDGTTLVASASQEGLRLWHRADDGWVPARVHSVLLGAQGGPPAWVAPTRELLVGMASGRVARLDPEAVTQRPMNVSPHGGALLNVQRVGVSSDRRFLVTFHADYHSEFLDGVSSTTQGRRLETWDVLTGRHASSRASGARLACMRVAPTGPWVLLGYKDGGVEIRDLRTDEVVSSFDGMPGRVASLAWSPSCDRVVAGGVAGQIRVWRRADGARLREVDATSSRVVDLAFDPAGERLLVVTVDGAARLLGVESTSSPKVLRTSEGCDAGIWSADGQSVILRNQLAGLIRLDVPSGRELACLTSVGDSGWNPDSEYEPTHMVLSPDGAWIASVTWDRTVRVHDAATLELKQALQGHDDMVQDVAWTSDGTQLVSCSVDGTTRIWEHASGAEVGRLHVFDPVLARTHGVGHHAPWLVSDAAGRVDGDVPAGFNAAGWVAGQGVLPLEALWERHREPGLLARLLRLGVVTEPRAIGAGATPVPPWVVVHPPDAGSNTLAIELENQGGGIGPVSVQLNGREVVADARGPTVTANAPHEVLGVDLSGAPNLLPGERNTVAVTAYDASRTTRRRGPVVEFEGPGAPLPKPHVWIVACGVSDYAGDAIDLAYPAHDAETMAQALELAGISRFGREGTHVELLTSPPQAGAEPATREAVLAALGRVAEHAKANDVVVVYLAGHGVVLGQGETSYGYLLSGVSDLAKPAPKGEASDVLTGLDLAQALAAVRANQRAVFLDTCAAGEVRGALRPGQLPAKSFEQLRERDGVFVLAGSARDQSSYESSVYGQGLLTYSLLLGLSCGCHFRDDVIVDVSRLMDFACERVPLLSEQMGFTMPQIPVKAEGDVSFAIGTLTPDERAKIPLAQPVPAFVRAELQRDRPPKDTLSLSTAVNRAVRTLAAAGTGPSRVVFLDSEGMAGAYQLTGRYALTDGHAKVEAWLWQLGADEPESLLEFAVEGACATPEDVAALARRLVERATEHIHAR